MDNMNSNTIPLCNYNPKDQSY